MRYNILSVYSLFLCIFLSVPSPAQNVSVSSNETHIIIRWDPPFEPNGVVNYTVLLQETDLVQNTTIDITLEEVTELSLIVSFETNPYREYVAIVTAQTGAGMGESTQGTLMTPEGGTTMPVLSITVIM